MINIGSYNELEVIRRADQGLYLTDGENDVLIPRKYVPPGTDLGSRLNVFVYTDSADRPIATTLRPKAVVGEFAPMAVKEVSGPGAFVDWGLEKDLLVPFAEQYQPMVAEREYVVRVVLDEVTNRTIGTTKLSRYLSPDASYLKRGQEVEILVYRLLPDGAMVVVDSKINALLPFEESPKQLRIGQRVMGYVKQIREDTRAVVSLLPQGYERTMEKVPSILEMLRVSGGFLPYGDQSSPEQIRKVFGMSKGAFKKLIGTLYREGKISIEHHGIRLNN